MMTPTTRVHRRLTRALTQLAAASDTLRIAISEYHGLRDGYCRDDSIDLYRAAAHLQHAATALGGAHRRTATTTTKKGVRR